MPIHEGFCLERRDDGWIISAYEGDAVEVCIPEQMDGVPVVLIAARAFEGNPNIISIEVPSSVTFIGNYAFADCPSLVRARVAANVDALNLGTFWKCSALVDVELPSKLSVLGDGTFRDCTSLVSVELPTTITFVGDSVFRDCKALESAILDCPVETIQRNAFRDCPNLSVVALRDTVTYVGPRVFQGTPSLKSISILGSRPENVVSALRHHGMAYLVADYAIKGQLVSFDEAKKLLLSKSMEDKVFAARVAAGYPDRLNEVSNKQTAARVLAEYGCTEELRVFEKSPGFLPPSNIQTCLDIATSAGHTETAAYLLDLLARESATSGPSQGIDALKL